MLNELLINIVVSVILLIFGFFYGKYRERKLYKGNNLEDYNYINEEVRLWEEKLNSFINSILKTEMVLDENILSKNEYDKAIDGKKHFRDFI